MKKLYLFLTIVACIYSIKVYRHFTHKPSVEKAVSRQAEVKDEAKAVFASHVTVEEEKPAAVAVVENADTVAVVVKKPVIVSEPAIIHKPVTAPKPITVHKPVAANKPVIVHKRVATHRSVNPGKAVTAHKPVATPDSTVITSFSNTIQPSVRRDSMDVQDCTINGDAKTDSAAINTATLIVPDSSNDCADTALCIAIKMDTIFAAQTMITEEPLADSVQEPVMILHHADSLSGRHYTGQKVLVKASGSQPVSGTVVIKTTVDTTVKACDGKPCVQRHYEIAPQSNAGSATATLTLYFTQQEFNNYNRLPAHGADLPTGPADEMNKANLRIYACHGASVNGMEIDPDDSKIVWNAAARQWEITFEVTGFGSFFAASVMR